MDTTPQFESPLLSTAPILCVFCLLCRSAIRHTCPGIWIYFGRVVRDLTVPPAKTLLACEARTSGSSVQVPCNHSCETIAPVRLIGVHRRRNLNGDSLMRTVDRGREWPYFDVSHCSTIQSGGSAARLDATALGHG